MTSEKKGVSVTAESPLIQSNPKVLKHTQPKKTSHTDNRSRIWTFVLYPDSAKKEWQDDLVTNQWICSPLHDKDKNPDGSKKKSHWHVYLSFPGKKSFSQVSELTKKIGGTIPQPVANSIGMIRYFLHLDNPEKVQYDKKGLISHGLDVNKYLGMDKDYEDTMCEIEDYIDSKKITEYNELVRVSRRLKDEFPDWHRCITTHTIHFSKYVSSYRYSSKTDISKLIKNIDK